MALAVLRARPYGTGMRPTPLSLAGHMRAVLILGLPLIGGHLGQFAIGATDTLLLGWYGVAPLAGGSLGSSFFFVLFVTGSGFGWAVMPVIATLSARGDQAMQIRRVARMGLWLSAAFTALVLPVFLLATPILHALGQPPEIAVLAGQYLAITGWGLLPALGSMVLKSVLAAQEQTRIVAIVTGLGVVVNAVVSGLLIFGLWGLPEMGLRGAALASVAVHLVTFGVLALHAQHTHPDLALFRRLWRPDWPIMAQVWRMGLPIGLTSLAEVGLFAASAVMIGWLGTVPLAAHAIALQIATATFMVHVGLSNAATIRVGRALGQGDGLHLRRGAQAVLILSAGLVVLTIAVFVTLPGPLVGLFLGTGAEDRAAILALGVQLVLMAGLFQAADAAQVMALGLLRGIQDTRRPMVLAAVSYWLVGLPMAWLCGFGLNLGAPGVWLGLMAGLAMAGVLLMRRFWRLLPGVLAPSGATEPPDRACAA